MELYHWDIQGAFCTSDVDKEIYMQPPTGYSLPPGKCLLLRKSLYGLRQSSALFFENLERWMLDYGFKPIGPDGVMFRLDREGQKLIVSLYVDDGVCASDSRELYDSFLADLSKKFTLSDSGKLSWYLGVAIDHDRENGISTLSQETYIDTLLERFSMTDAHPAPTPSEPGTRL
eukprot:3935922-Rhodomonas_salina.1